MFIFSYGYSIVDGKNVFLKFATKHFFQSILRFILIGNCKFACRYYVLDAVYNI